MSPDRIRVCVFQLLKGATSPALVQTKFSVKVVCMFVCYTTQVAWCQVSELFPGRCDIRKLWGILLIYSDKVYLHIFPMDSFLSYWCPIFLVPVSEKVNLVYCNSLLIFSPLTLPPSGSYLQLISHPSTFFMLFCSGSFCGFHSLFMVSTLAAH